MTHVKTEIKNMIMQSNVRVMNNVDTGYDTLWVDKNTCHNCITLHIPQPDDSPLGKGTFKVIELNAVELLEFLVRTQPRVERNP